MVWTPDKEREPASVRAFKETDAEEVCELVKRTLIEVNSKDYSSEEIRYLREEYFTPEHFLELIKGRKVVVLVKENEIIGTGAYASGMLETIYVSPDYHGLGYGKQIVEHLEDIAREDGVKTLRLMASLTAVGFYTALGYTARERKEHTKFGTTILMDKELSS